MKPQHPAAACSTSSRAAVHGVHWNTSMGEPVLPQWKRTATRPLSTSRGARCGPYGFPDLISDLKVSTCTLHPSLTYNQMNKYPDIHILRSQFIIGLHRKLQVLIITWCFDIAPVKSHYHIIGFMNRTDVHHSHQDRERELMDYIPTVSASNLLSTPTAERRRS